ncbi:murein L,D-transpeptidase [Mesorhizobium sp. BAC0120]|uniref:L,D-transpeptidase family protein n=1 Tax=Mesorhizobium sp. BAC0120 TaxID=3090670 RepID=UPI00298D4D81|nr:murein L,D-transpeptidase [Mesorhizobium sp. BAC0120]MDW6023706.1 murein L,D-transpeptidase [Mesorhizobium sp. BAC0120]
MKILGRVLFALMATSLVVSQPAAAAERIDGLRRAPAQVEGRRSLFDLLFGGPVRSRPANELPPAPAAPVEAPAVKPVKITAPSYYDYKPDRLVKVDFAPFKAIPEKAAFGPSLTDLTVGEAAAGLEGFDLYAEKDVAQALVDYYSANPQFIWVSGFTANGKAEEAIRMLGEAESYGLSPADYAVAVPSASFDTNDLAARKAELVRFEMTLSARVLRYVRDAQNGRVDPNRISGYHDFPPKPLDLPGILRTLAHTAEVRTYLESRHPQNPEYQALRVELEALRASEENRIVVDPKLLLKPGETSPELPKLLQLVARDLDDESGGEYGETLYTLGNSETYVPELVPVIEAAQKRAGLKPDGVIGPRTVAKLAGISRADRVQKVTYALEQLRWLPSDLGSPRVFINEPAFTASFIDGGEEKLTMRAVIGKPTNQTAFFFRDAEQVDYNPYWGVPQSILVNEMLPRLRRDPGYLDRAGYEVTDSKGRHIPSSEVDWSAYGAKIPFNVRQIPSEANALGELKILFPNKHAIYMHDTPEKSLFKRDARAFSHGCVRLADPRGMAAAVLGTTVDHIADKLKQGHSSEKVTRKIPVYVAYFTAWPNSSGKVEYFNDVYDRDAHLATAIEKTAAVRTPAS